MAHWIDAQQSIRLSHVCAYWRSVALSSPFLWNDIQLPVPCYRDFAARAHPLPLSVSFDYGEKGDEGHENLQWLSENASRIARLMFVKTGRWSHRIMHSLGWELPILRDLFLDHSQIFHQHPDTLLTFPALRAMSLERSDLPFGLLPRLTEVFISCIPHGSPNRKISKVISLIRDSPLLRTLTVRELDSKDSSQGWLADYEGGDVVEMTHIEHLNISGIGQGAIAQLFGAICIPASAPMIHAINNDPESLVFDHILHLSGTSYFEVLQVHDDANRPHLSVSDDTFFFERPEAILIIVSALDLTSVTSLSFEMFGFVHANAADLWKKILTKMPNLLRLSFQAPEPCLPFLLRALSAPITPQLQHLSLNSLDEDNTTKETEALVDLAAQILKSRSQQNGPCIKTLTHNLDINDEDLKRLQATVETVRLLCTHCPSRFR